MVLSICVRLSNKQFHVILAIHPQEMIRRRPEVYRPHALTPPVFVLISLVNIMRLCGIQSPDPIALTGFSGIIRPLSIMFYGAKGDMAVKVMVL